MESKKHEKQLPEVFNELKEIRRAQAQARKNENQSTKTKNVVNKKAKKSVTINDDFNYDIYQPYEAPEVINHKFNAIGAIIGILFFVLFMTTVKSNYIFANTEEDKKVIGMYEKNSDPIDLMECVSENISEIIKKEIVTEELIIEREIEYIENNQLPKNEEIIIQEGRDEYREITYIRSFENGELVNEIIINDVLKQETLKSIIQIGTSEFLANKRVHIGDTMYTTEEILLMSEPKENSNEIATIYQYIDFTLKEVKGNWCRIIVDGLEGYVKTDAITSAAVDSKIVEKNRIKRILLTLNFDMAINKPSGLTRADFTKMLSGNSSDIYKIFEENAGLFYDIEQKYNINGIFLASIGIHESNWGTSTIAREKKNLFGYGAYDSSAYASSFMFESYQYGIELLAKALSKYYINEPGTIIYDGEVATGTYYNGSTIPSVNVRYASDKNWANRVYTIMCGLYEKLED